MMLDPVQDNKIDSVDEDYSLKEYLDNSLCRDAGIIPLVVDSKNVKLGAMNPMFSEVHKISQKLKSFYGVNVLVEQISTEEWEKWFDNNDNLLNKNNLTNSVSENIEIGNSNVSSISDNSEEKKKNEKSAIKVEEESKLTNFSEFDFIDFGETEEDLVEEEE